MIPVIWLSKDGVCSRCRMDEWIVEDLLNGAQKRPATLPQFEHFDDPFGIDGDVVVVLPGGNHVDDVDWVNTELNFFDSVVLFITSDEGALFPVERLAHPNLKLWIQTPRPEVNYPSGTQFFGVGSGRAWRHARPQIEREHRLALAGQRTHARRDQAFAEASRVSGSVVQETTGFMKGMERTEYLELLRNAWWAPAPSGILTQDSFRFYEALEMGAIPIPDALRSDGGGRGYWGLVAPGLSLEPIVEWRSLRSSIDAAEAFGRGMLQSVVHEWWHVRRREMARTLARQLGDPEPEPMTVIIPTSPIPSHPSVKILDEVIASVRARTDAEILVIADGPRPEMEHRAEDYEAYWRTVLSKAEVDWWNVTPISMGRFCHQAEMLRRVMPLVDSEYILYVEHDAPLVNDINFPAVIAAMRAANLNLMRFYHETAIHPEHEHLMTGAVHSDGWRPTLQWSQRPHVAKRTFYERRVLKPHFSSTARVMIEDVMFGVCEHALAVEGPEEGWRRWRMGIWHPQGNIQRSVHLDGREGDPKFEQLFKYRYPGNEKPPGAPNPAIGS